MKKGQIFDWTVDLGNKETKTIRCVVRDERYAMSLEDGQLFELNEIDLDDKNKVSEPLIDNIFAFSK